MQAGYIARKEYEKEIQKPRNVKKAAKAAGAVYKLKKDEMACFCRIRMRLIDAHQKKRREVERAQKVISKYYLSSRLSMLPGVCTIYDIQKEIADALLSEIEELERSERTAASEHTQQKIRHYRVLSTLQGTRQRNINYLESLLELQRAFSVSIERHTAHLKAKLARERALYALRKIEESCALGIEEADPLRTAIAAHAKSIQGMSESIALLDRIYDIQQDIIFKTASSKLVYVAQNAAASEHERQERGLRKARKALCSAKNV
ncbi:hypothetical protein NEAUS03_0818 [Nematocida ausubeli]|nr:hypothetical protein NEAUS03_0818 [Nematocida ausubeli]